ncbi:hypothetical protein tb265_22260 [Gemmatimonadetes bacterium T265]|nr:hypothetical protein tb265_22260 [Gemmatimonadetes bacterium T265]
MTARFLVRAALLAAAAGCGRLGALDAPKATDADLLHRAVQDVTGTMTYDIISPPQGSRVYAYAAVAAYEAMRPGYPGYRTLAGQLHGLDSLPKPGPGSIYYPLAGIRAYLTVGRQLTFSRARMDSLRAAMDAEYQRRLRSDEFARSVAYGDTIAGRVLKWAGGDRFLKTRGAPKYSVTSEAGRWAPTPPAYMEAVEPHWGELRPFVIDTGSQFKPEPAYRFDTAAGSSYMRDVREVYSVGRALTPAQTAIADFWECNPYTLHVQGHSMFATKKLSPGGHWIGITGLATRKAGVDVMRTAAVYARVSVALADAFISSWDEKFRSNVMRPETVINRYVDEGWEPHLQTPPFPEYTSGHSVISPAAAAVLADEFGDRFAFADSVEMPWGLPVRRFQSFSGAAAEAGISRLYGGIHFRHSVEQGNLQGARVGAWVVGHVRTRDVTPRQVLAQATQAR